jgi:hypothetical protein
MMLLRHVSALYGYHQVNTFRQLLHCIAFSSSLFQSFAKTSSKFVKISLFRLVLMFPVKGKVVPVLN